MSLPFSESLYQLWEEFLLSFNTVNGKDKCFASVAFLFQFLSASIDALANASVEKLPGQRVPETSSLQAASQMMTVVEGALQTFRQGNRVFYLPLQVRDLVNVWKESKKDSIVNLLKILRSLILVPHFVFDNLTWLSKIKAIESSPNYLPIAMYCWLGHIWSNVLLDTFALYKSFKKLERLKKIDTSKYTTEEIVLHQKELTGEYSTVQELILNFPRHLGDSVVASSGIQPVFSRQFVGLGGFVGHFLAWRLCWSRRAN